MPEITRSIEVTTVMNTLASWVRLCTVMEIDTLPGSSWVCLFWDRVLLCSPGYSWILYFCVYWVFCLFVLCTMYTATGTQGGQKRVLGYLGHRRLWATMWVLGTEPVSCPRAASALNHWGISPAPSLNFFFLPLSSECLDHSYVSPGLLSSWYSKSWIIV